MHGPDRDPEQTDERQRRPDEAAHYHAEEHRIDLFRSFFIGDKRSDIESGRNAGVKTVLVLTGYGKDTDRSMADFVANNLTEAADLILRSHYISGHTKSE